jgi:hypothetical protein
MPKITKAEWAKLNKIRITQLELERKALCDELSKNGLAHTIDMTDGLMNHLEQYKASVSEFFIKQCQEAAARTALITRGWQLNLQERLATIAEDDRGNDYTSSI